MKTINHEIEKMRRQNDPFRGWNLHPNLNFETVMYAC